MKNILLVILIGYHVSALSQTANSSKQRYQDSIGGQSDNRFLCRFIGFSEFYGQNISEYLQLKYDFSYSNSPEKKGFDIFILRKNGIYSTVKPPKVTISFAINKDGRITSGKITGDMFSLASLFLYYWPQSPDFNNMEQLNRGIVALKHCYGDLISFKRNGIGAIIKITKDPNIIMPTRFISATK
jgi:hypothetical protein